MVSLNQVPPPVIIGFLVEKAGDFGCLDFIINGFGPMAQNNALSSMGRDLATRLKVSQDNGRFPYIFPQPLHRFYFSLGTE